MPKPSLQGTPVHSYRHEAYRIRSCFELSEHDRKAIADSIRSPLSSRKEVLGGRGVRSEAQLECAGRTVVKHYRRGGVFRHITRNRYVRFGAVRPATEFRLLLHAKSVGVNVPQPVAYLWQGLFLYRGWLVTQYVPHESTLAMLSLQSDERARAAAVALGEQIVKLIENRILHIDLHPGNVIVDSAGSVCLLDFDKASLFSGKRNALRDHYLVRWRRAVIKHGLPDSLTEQVCLQLRRDYDVSS